MDWVNKIERVLVGGFGEEVVTGAFLEFLDGVKLIDLHTRIVNNGNLLPDIEKYRLFAKKFDLSSMLTKDKIIGIIRDNRPDMLSVIINTPGGEEWLNNQIITIQDAFALRA